MSFTNRISQLLHDEHRATVALVERLEELMARHRRAPPSAGDPAVARLLADLSSAVDSEVQRHFAFEEERLFAFLNKMGDDAISAHLTEEHNAIRPLGMRMSALSRHAATDGFAADSWSEFQRLGGELCERMLAHVQKEEMALLPLLEEMMDPDTEASLYQEYTGNE
jgi:hemerythrin-like domain-containing protein